MAGLLHDVTILAFVLHIGGGTVGLFSGTVAALARKGGRLHRSAGTVFFVSMLVMAVFAIFLAVVRPGEIVNLVVGTFVIYLVVTAWLTAQRKDGSIGYPEKIALFVILCLCVPFGITSFEVAMGLPLFFKSAIPITGPIRIAVFTFTAVFAIASFADAKVILAGRITGAPRLARHLWRMSLALMLATGSAFTNGLPRLLPGHSHVPIALLFPQFIWLAFLIVWMIRVRFTGWYRPAALQPA
ncbi:MAG TPA: DUF2306 domain-containing protein [Rhizomicrobium sp.]|jgi:uncharacterized membrane protein|nr:DUF2306 domain-containing protein [Rhizomicrobium sp.]